MAANSKVEVFNTSSRGRGIKTKISIKAGDEVLSCDPYVFVSTSEMHGRICDKCFTVKDSLQRCSSCKLVYYCGTSCQRMAWKIHKLECKYLKKIAQKLPSDTVRLLALLLLQKNDNNEDWLQQLATHCLEIRREKSEIFAQVLALLNKYLDLSVSQDNETIFKEFCKINCNTFTISDSEMKPLGLGLYPTASFINHSCQPNCVIVFIGSRCYIQCIEDIQCGEELCISYTELLRPSQVRRKQLKAQYFFECTCTSCEEESCSGTLMNGLKCANNDCSNSVGFQQHVAERTCSACGTEVLNTCSSSVITELYQKIDSTLSSVQEALVLPESHKKALSICESLLSDADKTLHPFNSQVLKIVDKASDLCIETSLWKKALYYCMRSILGYQKFYPKYHPSIGLQLYRIGKLELYLDMLDAGFSTLSQAKYVLDISHGKKHPLSLQLNELLFQTSQEIMQSTHPGKKLKMLPQENCV